MVTSQIQIPIDFIYYPCVFILICLGVYFLGEIFLIIKYKEVNPAVQRGFVFFLNLFRAILYPMTIYIIYNGLTTSAITYPETFNKYTLVPFKYCCTIPILLLEGISGIRSVIYYIINLFYGEKRNKNFIKSTF